MSTTPTPPAAEPAVPAPAVPYGPPVTASGDAPAAAYVLDLSKRSVAGTAGKWAIRILLPLLIRAVFRAIFR
jgi:hypothetical protein